MTPEPSTSHIGIGATEDLSLRVSIATLVRVLFEDPRDRELILALERKATLLENEGRRFVDVKAQPFGGAIQIRDLGALQRLIGDFHFDSEQSRSEQDFRLFVRPSAWEVLRGFCLQQFRQSEDAVLDLDPGRELVEEFAETLGVSLKSDQMSYKPVGTIIENTPSPTENIYTRNALTVRLYQIFETHIFDPYLIEVMLMNSERYSDRELEQLALENFRSGGPGWGNTVLTLPLNQVSTCYLDVSPEDRNRPVSFWGYRMDETVAAILEDIPVPKYDSSS